MKFATVFSVTYEVFLKIIKKIYYFLMRNLYRTKPINYSKTFNLGSYTDFSVVNLVQSLNLKVKGVVQVGAHIGQEVESLKLLNKNLRFLVFETYEN